MHEQITIKYDTKNRIIYILIIKYKDDQSVHHSKLYFSTFESMTFQPVYLIYEGKPMLPTELHVSQGLAVIYSKPQRILFMSSNNGVSWSFRKMSFFIEKFFLHPKNPHKIVAIGEFYMVGTS